MQQTSGHMQQYFSSWYALKVKRILILCTTSKHQRRPDMVSKTMTRNCEYESQNHSAAIMMFVFCFLKGRGGGGGELYNADTYR